MRVLLVLLAACNQVYGLDETKLRFDAPLIDGPGCSDVAFVGPTVEGFVDDAPYSAQPQVRADLRELWLGTHGAQPGISVSYRASTDLKWGLPTLAAFSMPDDTAPTLSGDGLRIMWLSTRPGGQVWEATRASIDEAFPATATPPNGLSEYGIMSIDLSFDGKTLYFIDDQDLYETTRPAFGQAFGPARMVAPDVEFPSVSPDGLELFYNKIGETKLWRQTRSTTTDVFNTPTLLRDVGEDPDMAANATTLYIHIFGEPAVYVRPCMKQP